jgi:hypothetical protein
MKQNHRTSILQAIGCIVVCVIAIFIGMDTLTQPGLVSADAPDTEFSAERAMEHMKVIAKTPHPVGSPANRDVMNYIVDQLKIMGLSPEVQRATSVKTLRGRVIASTVHNVVVKIPGTNPSKSIALNAHYDSMPTTPGASDCGSCVVTLLETARALKAGTPLKKDIIFIFTDIEEFGPTLGAKAFFEKHRWAKEIGIVFNFEGIGRTGPSIMYETGPASGWLVRELNRVTSHPVAQSWLFDIYKRTPINTDFNVYSKAGISGLNFAYLNEGTVYHTLMDNYDTIDPRSVQHHGNYALSMTRHLGNLDLDVISDDNRGDSVYFTFFQGWLVNYPVSWAVPLSILIGIILVGVVLMGFRREQATVSGILKGLLLFLLIVIVTTGLTFGIWTTIYGSHSQYHAMIFGRIYNAHLYLFAFTALAFFICSLTFILFKRKARATDLTLGALIWWWVLTMATSIMMPGYSYLFAWPMLFVCIGLGWLYWKKQAESRSWERSMVSILCGIPALIIYAPSVNIMFQFAPTGIIVIVVLMIVLLLALLILPMDLITSPSKLWLPGVSFLLTLGFLAAGSMTADFDLEHPQPNSIAYLQNTEKGENFWFSKGTQPDAWTSQFFPAGKEIKQKKVGEFLPLSLFYRTKVITSKAPAISIAPPDLKLLDDQTEGTTRQVKVKLTSARSASIITMDVTPCRVVQSITIDGQRIAKPEELKGKNDYWGLIYYAVPPEGIMVTLELDASQPLKVKLTDQSWDLPEIPGMEIRQRPSNMIPMPNFDYGTIVTNSFELVGSKK